MDDLHKAIDTAHQLFLLWDDDCDLETCIHELMKLGAAIWACKVRVPGPLPDPTKHVISGDSSPDEAGRYHAAVAALAAIEGDEATVWRESEHAVSECGRFRYVFECELNLRIWERALTPGQGTAQT